jgi:hypothetical protein
MTILVSGTSTSPLVAEGTIESIDLVARVITIQFPRGPLTFDVPARCEILLNGERVKLRLLQPKDKVDLIFCRHRGFLTALELSVTTRQPDVKGMKAHEPDSRSKRSHLGTDPSGDPATVGPTRA